MYLFSKTEKFSAQLTALPYPVKLFLLTIIYCIASLTGLFFEVEYGSVSSIWLPSGLSLAVFLTAGPKYWPMILAGEFCSALTFQQPPLTGLIGGVTHLTEAALAYYLLRFKKIDKITASPNSIIWFTLLGSIIPTFIAAFLGAAALQILGLMTPERHLSAFLAEWLGDATGIMVLTPFLADLRYSSFRSGASYPAFFVLMLAMILSCAFILFLPNGLREYFSFIFFPFVVAAAFYFGLTGAGTASLILTFWVLLKEISFGPNDLIIDIYMAFTGTCAFTGYLVTALEEEREQDRTLIQRQNDYLNALQELIFGLIEQRNANQLLKAIVHRACQLIDTDSGYFGQNKADGENVIINVGKGIYHNLIGYEVRAGQGVAGRVWQSGESLMINNYQNSPLRHPDAIWDTVSAIIGVPIKLDNEVNGVLGVLSTEPDRRFTNDDLKIIQQFGELASVAWKNAAIHTQLSEQLKARELAEKSLTISEQTHREIFNSTSEAMMVLHIGSGQIIQANQAARILFGLEQDSKARNFQSLLVPGSAAPSPQKDWLQLCVESGPQDFEWCGTTSQKEKSWLEISLKVTTIQDQTCILAVLRCIDERKEAEQSLLQLRTAIEHTAEDVMVTDADGAILYVNPAFESHTGYTRQEILGKSPAILKSGAHDTGFYNNLWQTILGGNVWQGRLQNRRKDGNMMLQETSIAPFRGTNGQIAGFVSVTRDITEHEKIKQQLEQAQKLEAIGTMASGIAHDFNNILAAISGHAELASLYHLQPEHPASNNIREIIKAGKRAADLIRQILIFSQSSEIELKRVDFLPIAREICKTISATLPPTINLTLNCSAQHSQILATPSFIHQILLNLLTNGVQALKNHTGNISLTVSNENLDQPPASSGLPLFKANQYLKIEVSDNGTGMDKKTISKIFDPYFTTKGAGRGTGLGLSVVHGVVKQLNGSIKVESEPGAGTTFEIFIPVNTGDELSESEEEKELPRGSESILFVDDNTVLAEIAQQMLSQQGYKVRIFNDAPAALEHYRTSSELYDLLITDLVMPGMTGLELSLLVRENVPDIPIILCTGDPSALDTSELESIGINKIAPKPFVLSRMARLVRNVLDAA